MTGWGDEGVQLVNEVAVATGRRTGGSVRRRPVPPVRRVSRPVPRGHRTRGPSNLGVRVAEPDWRGGWSNPRIRVPEHLGSVWRQVSSPVMVVSVTNSSWGKIALCFVLALPAIRY